MNRLLTGIWQLKIFVILFTSSPFQPYSGWEQGRGLGGGKKTHPTSFSSVNSRNIGISTQNLLDFSFSPFAILV